MKRIFTYSLVFASCCFLSCKEPHDDKNDILALMNQYDRYILTMNTDSIASIYAVKGNLGDMAHGRESIARFLSRFKNYKVLTQKSVSDSLSLNGDSAFQKGQYWQTTVVPPADTVNVKGNFTIHWVWTEGGGWKIQRMDTQPDRK